ncbi:MAG: hypothetical protein ND866_14630 [Pyrinomonadaceae bacterium]|nr:hypothetical protein [Pyrinomonadaceae bacterium]
MMRKFQTLLLVLIVVGASTQVGAQGRSPLLDKVVLWSADDGYSYLYFRQGSIAMELSGNVADVMLFAEYAEKEMPAG